jgi:hypothetical protein
MEGPATLNEKTSIVVRSQKYLSVIKWYSKQ